MPNHIANCLRFHSPTAMEALEACKSPKYDFDFETLIPMPASVRDIVENGSDRYIPFLMNLDGAYLLWEKLRGDFGGRYAALPRWQGFTSMRDGWMETHLREIVGDAPIDNALAMIRAFAETGHKGWYEWSVANWGTKWNSYAPCGVDEHEGLPQLRFTTAWTYPLPVLQAFAVKHPNASFDFWAFDEGWNFFAIGGASRGKFTCQQFKPDRGDPDTLDAYRVCYGADPEPEEDEESEETDA